MAAKKKKKKPLTGNLKKRQGGSGHREQNMFNIRLRSKQRGRTFKGKSN